ncbi:MAG: hypothetical protein AAGE94_06265 [Acidobacteriota bacterium]
MPEDHVASSRWQSTFRALTAEARADAETDVTVDEARAYLAGEMAPEQAEAFREILSLNPTAARLVADMALFPEQAIDEAIDDGHVVSVERARAELGRLSSPTRGPHGWLPALAASLAVAVVGLAIWVMSLQTRSSTSDVPHDNVRVVSLSSVDANRDPTTAVPRALLPAWSNDLVLLLRVPFAPNGTRLDAEVARRGASLWRHTDLVVDEVGQITLTWSRDRLESGEYVVTVGSDADQTVWTYRLALTISDAP